MENQENDNKVIFESKIATTQYTWIKRKLDQGQAGRKEVNRYLMGVYYEPLQIYFRGCRLRWLADRCGNPEEIVHGFFDSRLSREKFFDGWRNSNKRLRNWVVGAFWHYLYELRNSLKREAKRYVEADLDLQPTGDDHVHEFDRAVAISIVQEALRRARELWERRGLVKHWQILILRFYEKLSYREIGERLKISEDRARKISQTARANFANALEETVANEVSDRLKVKDEIRLLLESLSS
ncbi:MAG: sigma factor-like helix-turn-helix DNA-binding protein [Planctomycetota bacterium]|nr:sigma factor-like helix-turn-helix DNA-binding protein [Planctomycetota bacterium]